MEIIQNYSKLERSAKKMEATKSLDNTKESHYDTAIFAGGCFWCMVEPFDTYPGIVSVVSGYTGGHVEAVEITFDPKIISYKKLVDIYWQVTDPTDAMGQFQDRGSQYQPIIFYNSPQQKKIAEESKRQLEDSHRFDEPIVTKIEPAEPFYPAEDYHQDFYKKDPLRYQIEEAGGRSQFIEKHWKK